MKKRDAKDYMVLVAKVMRIDTEAAEYMMIKATKMPSFSFKSRLDTSFVWENSPQGWRYWNDIAIKLG